MINKHFDSIAKHLENKSRYFSPHIDSVFLLFTTSHEIVFWNEHELRSTCCQVGIFAKQGNNINI